MSKLFHGKDTAEVYSTARALPEETARLWMDTLTSLVPVEGASRILDLGGGTGRFSGLIQKRYHCPVITIDPSIEMLKQGERGNYLDISRIWGVAEKLPLVSDSVDVVWMSNVFHHLADHQTSFEEIHRVLKSHGHLVIRNGTVEVNEEMDWMKCFPESIEFDTGRIPHRSDIISTMDEYNFKLMEHRTVSQLFASSYREYYDKISMRGISCLIGISDEAFNAGLERLRKWVSRQPDNQPVYEPMDIFSFHKI